MALHFAESRSRSALHVEPQRVWRIAEPGLYYFSVETDEAGAKNASVRNTVCRSLRPNDSYEPQLVINELALPPGGEWAPQLPGWLVMHVSSGVGYCLHPRENWELLPGAVAVLSDQSRGLVRASELGELRLQFFRLDPRRLPGLLSLSDRTLLEDAAGEETLSLRVLPPSAHISAKFKQLGSDYARNTFPARVQLLELFLEVFGGDFHQPPTDMARVVDAKQRLRQTLIQTPVADLVELSFSELVSKTRCSPRHLSRLFTELVGVSFREKQTELRLTRACELLATTDSKVVDVALESGYDSTSLFNAVFKQRLGTSPSKWRQQARNRTPAKHAVSRLRSTF